MPPLTTTHTGFGGFNGALIGLDGWIVSPGQLYPTVQRFIRDFQLYIAAHPAEFFSDRTPNDFRQRNTAQADLVACIHFLSSQHIDASPEIQNVGNHGVFFLVKSTDSIEIFLRGPTLCLY